MTVLGLIPARGGSKGLPRKNILPLHGKPLLQYTVEAALAAERLDRVILSTDDPEIADVGRRCGAEVPFLRPAELAGDQTPTLPVVQHAVEWFESRGTAIRAVCLLQPTHPLRRPEHIDACIELFFRRDLDSVVTVLPVPVEHHPFWVYLRDADGRMRLATGESNPAPRRQDLPPAFHREGSVYVTRRDVLMRDGSLYGRRMEGYLLDPRECVNIDRREDFDRAEAMMARFRAATSTQLPVGCDCA
jgi:CMP-N-acetylneuraminic acid synthetase